MTPEHVIDWRLAKLDQALAEAEAHAVAIDDLAVLHPLDSPSPFVRQARTIVRHARELREKKHA